jgi:hypothetical protein
MLLKIHGTSGAGKTTIVRDLMEVATQILPMGPVKRPEAYRLTVPGVARPVYVLGPYENTCGGMDGVSSVNDQIDLIHHYADLGHVIYEGLLLSTYYGSLGAAVERYGKEHVWAFLDTPIEVCIERVKARRIAAGNDKPLNERNTRERMKPIMSLKARVERRGERVVVLKHDETPSQQVLELLYGAR